MSSQNFESLRVLLKLKRYEQPPPRYFREFSGIVIDRIQAGERGYDSWWERIGFDLRPVLAGALGATACGLVLFGLAASEQPQETNAASFAHVGTAALISGASLAQPSTSFGDSQERSAPSTYPVIAARSSGWQLRRADVVPASFSPR